MSFDKERNFIGAEVDISRSMVYAQELPPHRAGYIVARLALGWNVTNSNGSSFNRLADQAFDLLTGPDTALAHMPPLPQDLLDTIIAYRAQKGSSRYYGEAAALLLAAAVDHGSKETFTAADHDEYLHDSEIRLG